MQKQPLDRYRLQKLLGKGGMSEVWLATDTVLERPVAVKFLHLNYENLYKDLFVNEARILASLNHPNITAIYDAVLDGVNQRCFIVMEYVSGQPLDRRIVERGRMTLDECLQLILKLLRALQYAHTRGIIHRDIKPSNIMLLGDEVKLTDFGLADLASRLSTNSDSGVGTEGYMPPEQVSGERVDHRSDLYAVGVLLFTMLTGGQLPFPYKAHPDTPPTPLRAYWPEAPLVLEQVINRLLAPLPAHRYQSAEEVLNVLSAIHAQSRFDQPYLRLFESNPPPLVGRAAELDELRAQWASVRQTATPQWVALRGEIGVGKQRLANEFLKEALTQGAVVGGRCDELQSPYAPYGEMLEMLFARGLAPLPAPENAQVLLNQIPALNAVLPVAVRLSNAPKAPQTLQWEFFEIIAHLFQALGPTVIYLQEAQFLDEASAALTRFLLRRGRSPLLVLTTVSQAGAPQTLAELGEVRNIDVPPLPLAAFHEHLNHIADGALSTEVAETVYRRSAGNMFYAEEIVRFWLRAQALVRASDKTWVFVSSEAAQDTPPSLANFLKRQTDRLSEPHRQALAVAALLGGQFDFERWVEALGGDAHTALGVEVLDRALSLTLLREAGPERYAFHPPDLTEVLLKSLSLPRRRLLHRQIAEQLTRHNADPILIAYHYEAAGTTLEAARALEIAAARATKANALQQAIELYQRALNLQPTWHAHEELGHLYRRKGQAAEARENLVKAIDLARQAHRRDAEARILNGLAFVLWLADQYVDAYRTAASVLKIDGISPANLANARSHMGMVAWLMGRLTEAEDHCRAAMELLKDARDAENLGNAYNRLGLVTFSLGKLAEADALFARALELRRAQGDWWGQGYCLVNQSKVAIERGALEDAQAHLAEANALFEKIESLDGLMVTRTNQARAFLAQGQAAAALPRLDDAVQLAKRMGKWVGYGASEIYTLMAQARVAAHLAGDPGALGDLDQAYTEASDALKRVVATGNLEYMARAHWALAQIATARNQATEAETHFAQALALFQQMRHPSGWIYAQRDYAYFLTAQGQPDRAAPLLQQAEQEAKRLNFWWPEKTA
jgi:tetratricopeptide (TPR) repeat protein/predicted Ser/Thr protein kinase